MKVAAIIEARMTSSRLPGKHMLKVGNKYVFEILVEQLSFCKLPSQLILATTVNQEDDALAKLALSLGVAIYRGNEDNVYERVVGAALSHDVDTIVEITADCPLIDPNIVDNAISIYLDNEYDYVSNAVKRVYPDGMDVQVFSTDLLRSSKEDILDTSWLEHVTLQFRSKLGRKKYSFFDMVSPAFGDRPDIEITLDELNDWMLIKQVYTNLKQNREPIICSDIVSYIDNNPSIKELYANIQRASYEI